MKHFILALMLTSTTVYAKTETKPVQPTMHKLFANMQELYPFMVDEQKFTDKKNEAFIQKKLKESARLIRETKHSSSLNSPTYQISGEVLENHFEEVERIFRIGNKSFARWQLNSTLPICMSCHTQSPSQSRHWDLSELTRGDLNTFNKAELSFMGRDFDSSLKMYTEIIKGFPDNKVSIQDIEKSFERIVVIFARVRRDFDGGIKGLQSLVESNKQLPAHLKKNVEAWIALFRIQKREGFPDPKKSNDDQILKYVEKQLKSGLWDSMIDAENPRLVKSLTVSGVLYEYLNTHPKTKIKPEILYWLGVIDKQIQETLFFSLSDLYLKQCMSEFPTHPTAKKCFDRYKLNTVLAYSGSGGTHLPPEVKKDLQFWSMKVYGKDKSSPDIE